jgi:hypothetical protein
MRTKILSATFLFFAATNMAGAFVGDCLIEVDGATYLSGSCNIRMFNDDGSFSIGTGDTSTSRAKHFAYVSLDAPGTANGTWNGIEGGNHAQEPLGALERDGACWVNAHARICAWRAE